MHGTVKQPSSVTAPLPEERGPPATMEEQQFDLRSLLAILRRQRWTIVATMAAVIALALLIVSQLQPRYTATALVAIDSRDAQMLGFAPERVGDREASSTIDTEVEIASSATVLGRAAEQLDLVKWPEFAPRPPLLSRLGSMFGFRQGQPAAEPPPSFSSLSPAKRAGVLEELAKSLNISRRGQTSIISISATTYSADGAANLANAVSDAYLQEQTESRLTSAERAATFLRSRVDSLAEDISQLEGQIDTFLSTTLAEVSSPEAKAYIAELAAAARAREADAAGLASLRAALSGGDAAQLSALIEARRRDLADQRKLLTEELGSTSQDRVADARQKLAALDEEIRKAATNELTAVQAQIASADTRMTQLRQQIDAALVAQQLPRDISVQLFRLQRDLDSRRSLYDSFLAKLGQVEQQSDFKVPDSRIIATAAPLDRPSFPPIGVITVGTLVFALFAGIGLAFLRENYIGGINSVEQLELLTGVPVVAGVPRYVTNTAVGGPAAAIVGEPLSAFSEAIRRIRLGVEALAPSGKMCILVTSPLPGDGKTTIALSLARQMSMTGSRTLLIDADMRHPSIHRVLGESPAQGLLDFLSEGGAVDQIAIVKEPDSKTELILGARESAIATDALLMSARFGDLVRFARGAYDVVIIDTPPIGLVVDARIVAKFCDVAVFVVSSGSTNQSTVQAALRDLTTGVNIPVCAVLNQVKDSSSYANGYSRKYRSYYR